MFKKDKKTRLLDIVTPKKRESHKKRNALIGLGAVVTLAIAGTAAQKEDQA